MNLFCLIAGFRAWICQSFFASPAEPGSVIQKAIIKLSVDFLYPFKISRLKPLQKLNIIKTRHRV